MTLRRIFSITLCAIMSKLLYSSLKKRVKFIPQETNLENRYQTLKEVSKKERRESIYFKFPIWSIEKKEVKKKWKKRMNKKRKRKSRKKR